MSGFNDMFSQLDQQTGNALAPPAPPPKPTGMQSMFDALDNDPKIRATSNLVAAQSVAPEHAAAALQASRATGIPQPAAEENLDQAKQSAQLKANVDTLDQNPNLANFVADNPLAARLAQDDFQKLGTLEQLTTALKTGVQSALLGNQTGRMGNELQAENLVGADNSKTVAAIQSMQQQQAKLPKLTGGMGVVQSLVSGAAGMVDNFVQGGAVGAAVGAGFGAAVGGVGALPGAGAGAVTGGFVDMASTMAGNQYLALDQIRGSDGQRLSEPAKQVAATVTGVLSYAMLKFGFGDAAEGAVSKYVTEAVTKPDFTAAMRKFVLSTPKAVAAGGAFMGAQEVVNITGEEVAKMASEGQFQSDPKEMVQRVVDATINGMIFGAAMHAATGGMGLYGDMRSAQRAESQAAMFKNLLDGSTDAKLRERDLQGFQQFMQSQTDGSPVENLYLPADKVRELYQGARIDPSNMTADPLFGFVPDMAKQLQESAANGGGGDVVIPTSDFVTHLAGTPLAEHLLPDLRVGADAMSVNEAKAFQAEYQERIKAAVDQAGKGAEPDSTQKIADEVRAQAKAAGYSDALASRYGAIYAARYAARAERRGLDEDPFALYQKEAPKIQDGEGVASGSFNQSAFHGTPFHGIDKFSTDKIGTGEGSQAFGWGLYFAGKKEVAEHYRKTLGDSALSYDGKTLEEGSARHTAAELLWGQQGDKAGAKEDAAGFDNAKDVKKEIDALDYSKVKRGGQLYSVEIPEDHQMLDFNKDWASQSPEVKKALKDAGVFKRYKENLSDFASPMASRNKVMRGENIYAFLAHELGGEKAASEYLNSLGIPGMKYKGGTIANVPNSGHNYVLFHGDHADINKTFYQDDGRARAARARAYDANPFRAFLGKHGISPEIASEFAPGLTERRKAMVQGYGPIFRKTGLSLDKLTERAAEEGFIEPGSTDASKVYELIQKAMRGERVVPMYAEGAAEHEMQARMDQQREFESEIQTDKEAAPPEDIQILVDNSDPDADIPWDDVASNVSEESALKSLGFTDDEIQTLLTERSSKTDEAAASDNESGAAAGSQAQGNTGRDGQQQAGGSSGLTGPRGSIQFSDGSAVISLFAKADSSTLIHESGHAWLEELVADGSSEDAPRQLKDDLATVREWLGNDGGDLTTDQHEQFARAAEAYLMEGKTPSVALARVFSRFKQWLTKLYRTVRALDTPINDDIRGVFDRLLATDAEIDEAKRSTGLEPNFKSKEDAGMTTAEWNAYTGAIDKANAQAESTLLDKMMARVRRQRTAEYKEERAKAVEAATTEVDARPDIQALTMLRSVKADAQKIRLSSADIESVYGKDGVAAMPKGTLAKDGVHPDYVAEMLGFNSGDELVKSLQALEKQQREIQAQEGEKRNIRKYLIDQAADQKMEPHSADMLDEQSIREEAQAAVHSESRAALLAQELRYLKRSAARALEERGKGRKAADQVKTEADWNAAEADLMAKLDKAQAVAAAEEKAGKASDKAQATIADLKQQIADLKMTDRWKDAEADLVRKMDTAKQADEQRRLRESVLVTKETLEAIGKQVDGILDNKTTEEIGTFGTYLRDERKAARLVQQAILKKDWAAAAAAKQRQLISHILYSKAKAASDVIDRGSANMKRLTDKKTFKSIEQEYTDQIQDLLRRFGFDSGRGDELQRALKGSLEDFVKTKSEESGIELSVDPALYTLSKDVKSLTYAQFKALDEAVRSMQEIGRGMKMIEVDGQLRDVEEVKAEIVAAIRELGERMKSDFYDPRDAGQLAAAREKLFGIFRGIDASLTKPEALFDQIDKGNAFGIMNRAIFRRLKEAQGREDAWHEVASKEMKDAVEAAGKDWAKHLSDVVPDEPGLINPETGRPMKLTRKRMISMALNWGNEGNRIKLAEGYKRHPSTIQQFLNKNMTKADWDFAQRVWKMFDSHKQDLDDLQRRVTGVGLDMVQADAFDTPHGRYEGGYYPIVYDAGKSYQAEAHAEKATEALFPSNYTRATTPKGSTISRVKGVKRPIQLSLDVAPWKIGQTIHDLAFREAIIDADRLLSSDSVKKAMDDVFGPEYRKMLRPWLKHIANSKNIDDAAISWMDKAISTARTNTVIVGIGFRLSTMFKHGFSALSNSFKEVGPEWMLKGTREFYAPGRLKENWDFITSKSAEMKYRMNAYDKDVTSKYNELLTDSTYTTFQKQAQHFGHLGVSYLDLGSAAPTWLGAYRKALSQGMEDKDAVYVADKTVRNAHGAQGITDTAQIQRTTGVANLVNMFYGFFNHIYNRQRTMFIQGAEGVRNTKAGDYKAASKNFADVLATSFWYLAVPALVEAMATNGGPSEKKDEGWGEWASKAILAEIPAGIPVIRDIAKAAIEGRDYEVSPIAKAVTDVLHAGRDISDMVQGLDPKESMGKHIATAAGYIAGLPTAAPFTAGKFLWDINNGDADPQSIKDWYQGLTRGKVTQE